MLSTCNRIEVYAVVDAFHGGLADVSSVLGRHAGLALPELTEHLYVHYAGSAARRLFAVAAGLGSMVIGEAQILGQLRAAYAAARPGRHLRPQLHELSRRALRISKRVHAPHRDRRRRRLGRVRGARRGRRGPSPGSRRGPGRRRRRRRDGRARRRAPASGAAWPRSSCSTARGSGPGGWRQRPRDRHPARTAPLSALPDELAVADVLVTCTGALGTVVPTEAVAAAITGRSGRPLVVCDLGLPRDVDPDVAELPGVTVVDLAALQERLALRAPGEAVAEAQELVAEEAQAFLVAQRSAEVTPTLTALRRRASEVVDAELLRLSGRLPGLDPRSARSSPAPSTASSTSSCTPRRCRSSGWPEARTGAATRSPARAVRAGPADARGRRGAAPRRRARGTGGTDAGRPRDLGSRRRHLRRAGKPREERR